MGANTVSQTKGEAEEYATNGGIWKNSREKPNETEISSLLDKELKEIVIRKLNKLESTIEELSTSTER